MGGQYQVLQRDKDVEPLELLHIAGGSITWGTCSGTQPDTKEGMPCDSINMELKKILI